MYIHVSILDGYHNLISLHIHPLPSRCFTKNFRPKMLCQGGSHAQILQSQSWYFLSHQWGFPKMWVPLKWMVCHGNTPKMDENATGTP